MHKRCPTESDLIFNKISQLYELEINQKGDILPTKSITNLSLIFKSYHQIEFQSVFIILNDSFTE